MTSRTEHNDPRSIGGFALTYHYEMLSDLKRVTPFVTALAKLSPGKVVFESGTGTGVLSILAARSGAKAVFCAEIDPQVAEFAKKNFASSGVGDRITLLQKSTLDVTPADLNGMKADILLAENLSTWQVMEPQNQVMNHMRSTLAAPGAVSVPECAFNYMQLAHSEFRFFETVELRTSFYEFSGIRGCVQRSAPVLFSTFDYREQNETVIEGEMLVTAWSSGTVNSLRLTSPLKLCDGVHFDSSDSLMPAVVVPLPRDITVSAGEKFRVTIRYGTNTCWEDFECDIRPAG